MPTANDPAREGEADRFQFPAEASAIEQNRDFSKPIRGAPLHLIGHCRCTTKRDKRCRSVKCLPTVVVTNRGTLTSVDVANAPWGFGKVDRVYLHRPLHTSSPAAERYALELRQRLADAAWKESARLERIEGRR